MESKPDSAGEESPHRRRRRRSTGGRSQRSQQRVADPPRARFDSNVRYVPPRVYTEEPEEFDDLVRFPRKLYTAQATQPLRYFTETEQVTYERELPTNRNYAQNDHSPPLRRIWYPAPSAPLNSGPYITPLAPYERRQFHAQPYPNRETAFSTRPLRLGRRRYSTESRSRSPSRWRSEARSDSASDDISIYPRSEPYWTSSRRRRRVRNLRQHELYHERPSTAGVDRRGWNEDSETEGEYEDVLGRKIYSFTPRRSSSSAVETTSLGTDDDDGDAKLQSEALPSSPIQVVELRKVAKLETRNGKEAGTIDAASVYTKLLHVVESKYTGDAIYDGDHSAKLKVIQDPKQVRQSLYRWVHLQQTQLNLDELSAEITRIPGLSTDELHGLTKLLGQVRGQVKKPRTADGRNVLHMEPGSLRVMISGDNRAKGPGTGPAKGPKRSLAWFCIPYFTLEKYSGLMAAKSASSFPTETLLQNDYGPTSRARDMEQVVVLADAAEVGECVHVAQLWCIVLGDSLVITCGRMSRSALQDDIEPASSTRMICVSYYQAFLWALPLDECWTWFTFVRHFKDFWPDAVRFYHRDKALTENDWPRIVKLARQSSTRVTLELRMSHLPQPPAAGVLQTLKPDQDFEPNDHGLSTQTIQNEEPEVIAHVPKHENKQFHVFTWMDCGRSATGLSTDSHRELMMKQLKDMNEYLLRSTSNGERGAYKCCKTSSREQVHAYLVGQDHDVDANTDEDLEQKQDLDDKIDLYNAADLIFCFFFPTWFDSKAPTIGKFWSAVESMITSSRSESAVVNLKARNSGAIAANVSPVRSALRSMTREILSFQGIMSNVAHSDRLEITVPDDLLRAWLHLVMALVQASEGSENWIENMDATEILLSKGMSEIMQELPVHNLLDYAVVRPMELVPIMTRKLTQELQGSDLNLNDTYSQYIKHLENMIMEHPDRSHQYLIGQVKKEIDIIRRVISSQQRTLAGAVMHKPIIEATRHNRYEAQLLEKKVDHITVRSEHPLHRSRARDGYYAYDPYQHGLDFVGSNRDPDEFSKLSSTDPGGFSTFLVRDCLNLLDRKSSEFRDFLIEADRLEESNVTNLDINKDKQEKAVYAFTMVTIIFLPLGTISSIFGMNTSDIANLELSQWIYWVTALPTIILVIIAGLWWMGELEVLKQWLFGARKGQRFRRGGRSGSLMTTVVGEEILMPDSRAAVTNMLPPRFPRRVVTFQEPADVSIKPREERRR
ncbi:hypothetical protein JX265_001141 [Neoarthrinium moseri]|uniref:Mg2+ transporter n=1 Tax=Neoarthrinium moseri TaxID=1658444 RepID=A0A9Q0AVL6_9PEZI|nr:hypothetical protein JX265_001141 [Neoarthrinium moseri]